jgi:2-amino-4-hydroxy-6-hydroxymethyldihydropteridine diphosphokinase
MAEAVLALGSNLGDRAANLAAAVEALRGEGVTPVRASSVWETPPVPPGQPVFLNAVIVVETALPPDELLAAAKRVEAALGRRPTRRWGPRVIDVDVLFYEDIAFESDALTIPHPRIADRAFVLVPLAEALPGPLPVLGRTAAALLEALPAEQITRTPYRLLP